MTIIITEGDAIVLRNVIALTKIKNLQFSLSKKTFYFDIITARGEWRVMGTREFVESEREQLIETMRNER